MRSAARFVVNRVAGAALLFLALAASAAISVAATAQAGPTRVLAVGDIHGAFPQFVGVLQKVGLVDANRQWIGGSAVLVQCGDVMDRGAQSKEALDLLIELEREAPKQGGRVVPVLGNHETMMIMGDLRYTTVPEFNEFATAQSEKVREDDYQEYRKYLATRDRRLGRKSAPENPAVRQKWMEEHPLGFFEQRDAYAPDGLYGRWLRKHDAVAQVDDVLFAHGGLDPELRFRNIGELNKNIRSDLETFDYLWRSLSGKKIIWRYMRLEEALSEVQEELKGMELPGHLQDPEAAELMQKFLALQGGIVIYKNGPLWYRGYVQQPAEKLKGGMDAMLGRLKAHHVVVGHTVPDSRRITPVLDNRIFMIDTGMLVSVYQGHPSALEIQNGRFTANYLDGEPQVLLQPPGPAAVPGSSPNHPGAERNP